MKCRIKNRFLNLSLPSLSGIIGWKSRSVRSSVENRVEMREQTHEKEKIETFKIKVEITKVSKS